MLHAVGRRKTRIHHRYTGRRDGEEGRVSAEDEIASTVFGPLDFMADADAYFFWRSLLTVSGRGAFLPDAEPCRVSLALWDRAKSASGRSWVEPDLVVRMHWPDGRFKILLIELKWRAPLSGSDQLRRQWLQYLSTDEERAHALHLYIGFDVSGVVTNLLGGSMNEGCWNGSDGCRLIFVSWMQVRGVLKTLSMARTALGRWAGLGNKFLEQLEVLQFTGFSHLCASEIFLLKANGHVFWRGCRFAGWGRLMEAAPVEDVNNEAVFFGGV